MPTSPLLFPCPIPVGHRVRLYTPQTRPEVSDHPRADLRQSDTREGLVAAYRIVPVSTKRFTATYLTLDEAPAR